jgi:hypothetical protein
LSARKNRISLKALIVCRSKNLKSKSPKLSSHSIGLLLIAFAVLALAVGSYHFFRIGFWLLKPAEKMASAWSDDIRLLEKSRKLPKEWNQIREVSIRADNSSIQEWLKELRPPIHRDPKGKYRLDIFLVFWIEGYRYGTVVQYYLVDLQNENTIWEDGRTFKLGIVY